MMGRLTYSGPPDIRVWCEDCAWTYEGKNGVGLAAQHCDRYGHTVHFDSEGGGTFTQEGSPWHQRRQNRAGEV